MSPPRIVVIANPKAASGGLGARWADVAAVIRRELGGFDEARTTRAGEATSLCRRALDDGADIVVAIGGDGTVSEVANGFFDGTTPVSPRASLGVIPFGTGGDFRKTVHLPRDIAKATRIVAEGNTRQIDVGHMQHIGHDGKQAAQIFINVSSFGMSGLVVQYANESSKRLGGRLTFLLATARATLRYTNQRVRLTFDDDPATTVETTISTVAVANGRFFGGGMQIAPDAELSDGELDVVALGDLSIKDFLIHSRRIYAGTHLGLEKISFRRARSVRAEALGSEIIKLDADGEQPGSLPVDYRVLPGALSLIVP